ncbi:hypothetical protein ACJMK2_041552 [Sinanodonta woodiana]|uniref:Mesoderm induction early response protein 1 n=1 Tax=Sinanodonta woodiana TaxID=1069815 RepID=A0ABD3W7T3_SINWO
MAEVGTSESSSPDTDKDFDPSAEMLIHDYDDERTLEEEEQLSGEDASAEIDALEKEGEMPIEELLAVYGYSGNGGVGGESSSGSGSIESQGNDTRSSSEEEILSNHDLTLDKDEIARDLLQNSDQDEDKETSVHDLLNSVSSSHTARLLRSSSQPGSEDESSEDDEDYEPVENVDWKKTIQVGHSYQAVVPEGLCSYGDAPAYENEDRLLWDPCKLDDIVVEKYLEEVQTQALKNAVGVDAVPTGAHIRDDEQALYLLLQCGHNVEEALRRRKMQAVPPTDPMSLWSEEECRNFENGLRIYGKDFYLIQQNKVKTRSVGELIQFYYLWKKTERHDVFANKTRLEKRRFSLHPGVTDYMDRFLDDQDTPPTPRDRSASPIRSLLSGDPKRHQQLKPPAEGIDCPDSFQQSTPFELDTNTGSPTVTFLTSEQKSKNASPEKAEQPFHVNGVDDSYQPPFKKSKTEGSENLLVEDEVSSTTFLKSQNYKDSHAITSVTSSEHECVSLCSEVNKLTESSSCTVSQMQPSETLSL